MPWKLWKSRDPLQQMLELCLQPRRWLCWHREFLEAVTPGLCLLWPQQRVPGRAEGPWQEFLSWGVMCVCFLGSQGEKGKCFTPSSNTQLSEPSYFRTLCSIFFFPCAGSSLLWAVDNLFLVVASKGHFLVAVHRLFIAGASLVAEYCL